MFFLTKKIKKTILPESAKPSPPAAEKETTTTITDKQTSPAKTEKTPAVVAQTSAAAGTDTTPTAAKAGATPTATAKTTAAGGTDATPTPAKTGEPPMATAKTTAAGGTIPAESHTSTIKQKKQKKQKQQKKQKKPETEKKQKSKKPAISAVQKKIAELKKELENIDKKHKEKIMIKDAHGQLYCQNENCDQAAQTDNFCRYHYLASWPYIHAKKKLLKENYLSKNIQDICNTFGESSLLCLIQDCKNEKSFKQAMTQMMLISQNKDDPISASENDY